MNVKFFCTFEKKEVNVEYYDCPNRFKNCQDCSKLKRPSKKDLTNRREKPRRLNSNQKPKRDLFSSWNVYPVHIFWRRNPKSKKLELFHPDQIQILLEDSQILEFLIDEYEREIKENKPKGIAAFWRHVESLSNWRQGTWECLNQQEKDTLMAARDGSMGAIQQLVIANPRMIHLPFIADKLEDLIRIMKFREGTERKEAQKLWAGFTPKRSSHKDIVTKEHLRKILKNVTEVKNCTKGRAGKILHGYDRSFKEERLRKTSIAMHP